MTKHQTTGFLNTSGKIKKFRTGLDIYNTLRPQAPHRAEKATTTARKETT